MSSMRAAERRGHSCFMFGRSRVQVSTQKPIIMTEVFRGFTQFLQANARV
jgi:hypothetical protein